MRCVVAGLLVMGLAGGSPRAQDNVLEIRRAQDVRVKTLQPQSPTSPTSRSTNGARPQIVKARTEGKTDGTEDMIVVGYDPKTNGYPFWIFSSRAPSCSLRPAPGTRATEPWNGKARRSWTSPTRRAAHSRMTTTDAVRWCSRTGWAKCSSSRTAARSAATIDHASILPRKADGALLGAKDLPACRCVAAFSLPIATRSGSLQDTL